MAELLANQFQCCTIPTTNFLPNANGMLIPNALIFFNLVVLHKCRADNELNQENNADASMRQPRFASLEEPIFLIRPVAKDKTGARHPPNRQNNQVAVSPSMMGNGFVIRAQTGKLLNIRLWVHLSLRNSWPLQVAVRTTKGLLKNLFRISDMW